MQQIKVLILGSCVSRDPFGIHPNLNSDYLVVDYYARTSLASLCAMKCSTVYDLSKISSPFQRNMVHRDFCKDFFTDIGTLNFDVLLMDFVDDRFGLLEFFDGSAITDSDEFRSAKLKFSDSDCILIPSFSNSFYEKWSTGSKKLWDFLKRTSQENKVLINKVYWAHRDDQNIEFPNGDFINVANSYLDRLYGSLESFIPKRQFICYDGISFVGSTSHMWGRSCFHYTKDIQERCLTEIKRFVDDQTLLE